MKVVAHTGSYNAGVEYAKQHHPGKYFSVQHVGQGWQKHKWCVLVEEDA